MISLINVWENSKLCLFWLKNSSGILHHVPFSLLGSCLFLAPHNKWKYSLLIFRSFRTDTTITNSVPSIIWKMHNLDSMFSAQLSQIIFSYSSICRMWNKAPTICSKVSLCFFRVFSDNYCPIVKKEVKTNYEIIVYSKTFLINIDCVEIPLL